MNLGVIPLRARCDDGPRSSLARRQLQRALSLLCQLLFLVLAGTAVSSAQFALRGLPGPVIVSFYLIGPLGAGIMAYRLCCRAYPPTRRDPTMPRSSASINGRALLSALVVAFLVVWVSMMVFIVNTVHA